MSFISSVSILPNAYISPKLLFVLQNFLVRCNRLRIK